MMRFARILFLGMVVVGLMAGSAFAATGIGNTTGVANTAVTVATELVGTSAGYSIADDGTVFYAGTNAFVQNDVITFTLANVALYDAAFSLCKTASAVAQADYIGSVDATNGVSTLVFRVAAAGIPAATEIFIAGAASCIAEAAYTTGTQKLSVKFPQLTSAASATISAAAVFGTGTSIPGATAAAVNLYTVANQYAATVTNKVDVIDFSNDMKKILVLGAGTGVLLDTGNAFTLTSAALGKTHTLIATDKMDLTISGSMSGISRICWNDAACASSSTKRFVSVDANTQTYSVLFSTAALTDFSTLAITFVFDGTTPLTGRNYTVTAVMNLTGANELDRTLLSASNYLELDLNAYQAICPFVKYNAAPAVQTIVRLSSTYISSGTVANVVKGSVLCASGTASVVTLGTITPGTTFTILASDIVTAAGATCIPAATALGGFPVTFTVNAPAVNVAGVATVSQPEGLRGSPMKSNNTGFSEYVY